MAEPSANPRYPGIVVDLQPIAAVAEAEELVEPLFGVDRHRPELGQHESVAALADALLSKQHRARRVELDRDRRRRHHRREEQQTQPSPHHVHRAFEESG